MNTTADSGAGSLRQAILDANATAGKDSIFFDFSKLPTYDPAPAKVDTGEGMQTFGFYGVVLIRPTGGSLPPITEAVVIDGSRSGLSGPIPSVEIRGNASAGSTGLLLESASGSAIDGLIINSFEVGISLLGSVSVTIGDCDVGIAFPGTGATGNQDGIQLVLNSGQNSIQDCVVANNKASGIAIADQFGDANRVTGSLIASNRDGIEILGGSSNRVGDAAAHLGNRIVNNADYGIYISELTGATYLPEFNRIEANEISHNAVGVALLNSGLNTIGGLSTAAGNTITANDEGIIIYDVRAASNLVEYNDIGVLPNGSAVDAGGSPTGNDSFGIRIWNAPNNSVYRNVVSDTNPRRDTGPDFLSGAGFPLSPYFLSAILVALKGSTGNTIVDNKIGTNPAGTAAVPNTSIGVSLVEAPSNVVVGNVISGSRNGGLLIPADGVEVSGAESAANVLNDNLIGTDAAGAKALYNDGFGILLDNAPRNTIGGTASSLRNVISGNGLGGIALVDGTSATWIAGNFIGVNRAGTAPLANGVVGVGIQDSPSNTLGGTALGAGNVISGNAISGKPGSGVAVRGQQASGNWIQGNTIGLNAFADAAIPNQGPGIYSDAPSLHIGGTATYAGNLIDGNDSDGIYLTGPGAAVVEGNLIGVESVVNPNQGYGVEIENAPGTRIGGTIAGAGNTISDNRDGGVRIAGSSTFWERHRGQYDRIGAEHISAGFRNHHLRLALQHDRRHGGGSRQHDPVLLRRRHIDRKRLRRGLEQPCPGQHDRTERHVRGGNLEKFRRHNRWGPLSRRRQPGSGQWIRGHRVNCNHRDDRSR